MNKQPSFTKSGPGRRPYTQAERRKSAAAKSLHSIGAGAFGRALSVHFNAKRAAELAQRPLLRDKRGAYTLTGPQVTFIDAKPGPGYHETGGSTGPDGFAVTCRRKWLAGISAQRGF